jgi:uncharacterized damage-inducible protein DinB
MTKTKRTSTQLEGRTVLNEIRRIYEYHDWANHQVLDAAGGLTAYEERVDLAGSFSTFIQTLRHILLVEFLFISRWQDLPPRKPEWETTGQIRAAWLSLEIERNQFLTELNESRLAQPIHYVDTRGRSVTLELWQAIFQCVNHSTFHRGQAIEKLRKLGKIPPATDYVLFCRGIGK